MKNQAISFEWFTKRKLDFLISFLASAAFFYVERILSFASSTYFKDNASAKEFFGFLNVYLPYMIIFVLIIICLALRKANTGINNRLNEAKNNLEAEILNSKSKMILLRESILKTISDDYFRACYYYKIFKSMTLKLSSCRLSPDGLKIIAVIHKDLATNIKNIPYILQYEIYLKHNHQKIIAESNGYSQGWEIQFDKDSSTEELLKIPQENLDKEVEVSFIKPLPNTSPADPNSIVHEKLADLIGEIND